MDSFLVRLDANIPQGDSTNQCNFQVWIEYERPQSSFSTRVQSRGSSLLILSGSILLQLKSVR